MPRLSRLQYTSDDWRWYTCALFDLRRGEESLCRTNTLCLVGSSHSVPGFWFDDILGDVVKFHGAGQEVKRKPSILMAEASYKEAYVLHHSQPPIRFEIIPDAYL